MGGEFHPQGAGALWAGRTSELLPRVHAAVLGGDGRQEGREWRFPCPRPDHRDEHPSARWDPQKGTWYCDVCEVGGGYVELARLLGVEPPIGPASRFRVVAEYPYQDASGTLLYVVERRDPKGFRQRRPDGAGGWIWSLGETTRVLYRLPELLAADSQAPVLIPEGEKDVETLRARGFVATCNVGGAGKWRPEYGEPLGGRDVVILPDADSAGRRHAEQVATALDGVAASIKVVAL